MKQFASFTKNSLRVIGFLILVASISVMLFWAISPYTAPTWTGFGEHKNAAGEIEPPKTLWNWMELLIVPLVLAIGVWWLNRSEKSTERELAENRNLLEQKLTVDRLQETALQNYFDRMSDLLLNSNLRKSKPEDEVRSIARSRTLSVLRSLDSNRKGTLIRFLYESGLIIIENTVIPLAGADFSFGSMAYIRLWETNLKKVNFTKADLTRAKLQKSDLTHAVLSESTLYHAYFILANLQGANLTKCNLIESDFTEAHLEFTLLSDSNMERSCFHKATLRLVNFSNCNLKGSKFTEINSSACNFSNSNLANADFSRSKLMRAKFINADLRGANFKDADLTFADLTNTNITKDQLNSTASLLNAKLPKLI